MDHDLQGSLPTQIAQTRRRFITKSEHLHTWPISPPRPINHVVPSDQLDEKVYGLARRLAGGAIRDVPLTVDAEVAEVFMATQAQGVNCGFSNGEALSRVLPTVLYPKLRWRFIALEWRDRLVIHQPKGNSFQIAPSFTVKHTAALFLDPLRPEGPGAPGRSRSAEEQRQQVEAVRRRRRTAGRRRR